MSKRINIKAMMKKKMGRLLLLKEVAPYYIPVPGRRPEKKRQGLFLCECGTEKVIALGPVRQGKTRSCGCIRAGHKSKLTNLPSMWS